jgi:hypothetical protein
MTPELPLPLGSAAEPRSEPRLARPHVLLPGLTLIVVVGLAIAGDIWAGKTPVSVTGPVGIGAAILLLAPLAVLLRLAPKGSETQLAFLRRRRYVLRWYAVYYAALVSLLVFGPITLVITPR